MGAAARIKIGRKWVQDSGLKWRGVPDQEDTKKVVVADPTAPHRQQDRGMAGQGFTIARIYIHLSPVPEPLSLILAGICALFWPFLSCRSVASLGRSLDQGSSRTKKPHLFIVRLALKTPTRRNVSQEAEP
jgi:hypothetical protein